MNYDDSIKETTWVLTLGSKNVLCDSVCIHKPHKFYWNGNAIKQEKMKTIARLLS